MRREIFKVRDKLKKKVNSISEKLGAANSELAKVVKGNQKMLQADEELAKDSIENIQIMKNYATKETPAIKDAFISVSESLEAIEDNRTKMTAQLQDQYLSPIQELLEDWKTLEIALKEDDDLIKKQEQAKNDLDKLKAKPPQKKKPGEEEQAAAKFQQLSQSVSKSHDVVTQKTTVFNEKKINTLKSSLATLVEMEKDFYQSALNEINQCTAKISAIDVQKELKQMNESTR